MRKNLLKNTQKGNHNVPRNTTEGYVMRRADAINYGDFRRKVAKFVRKGHLQTAKHWMYGQRIERNIMIGGK